MHVTVPKRAAADQTSHSAQLQRLRGSVGHATAASSNAPIAGRVSSRELARKLWHMAPGYLILGLPLVRRFEPFATHLPTVIVVVTVGLLFLSWHYAASLTRPGEGDWGTSVWAFAATALLPLLAFPSHCELSLTAVVLLSLGDGAAALGGQMLGGARLPWNSRKTFAGTVMFALIAAPAAAWVYWANADPGVSFVAVGLCALIAAAFSSVVESLPSRINDNIRVGVAAVLSVVLIHTFLAV